MVYMDSAFFTFCIRNALGGACDESMVLCHFMIHGPPVTHTKWGSDRVVKSEMWRLCASVNSNKVQKCTSIIKNNQVNQNPVDPAGPDCYRIDTKPCESL